MMFANEKRLYVKEDNEKVRLTTQMRKRNKHMEDRYSAKGGRNSGNETIKNPLVTKQRRTYATLLS